MLSARGSARWGRRGSIGWADEDTTGSGAGGAAAARGAADGRRRDRAAGRPAGAGGDCAPGRRGGGRRGRRRPRAVLDAGRAGARGRRLAAPAAARAGHRRRDRAMSETLALSLPYHVYGVVDCRFVSGGERDGWIPAVWFGVTLPRNRALGLTVLLDNGAQYRELPSHAWAFTAEAP